MSSRASTQVPMTGLDGKLVKVEARALEALLSSVHGPVLRPGDVDFDEAVTIWNGMVSKRPALVVQPVSAADVRQAVTFARTNGVLLSVKSGGHHIAGTALTDGGLTLDMSRMKLVDVDPERRVARVDAGCLLGDVDRATQEHGLATVLGSDAETGVAGLTLGGGFGYLTRRFGWTVDNLEEVEIVTAGGELLRAAEDEHEDLFWALRGGGGNFGVVTRFTFRLHEVGPQVTGGLIVWDADQAEKVVGLYRDITVSAPRALTLALTMRLAPSVPFIPERQHGRPIAGILACHTGDLTAAARDLAPIRALGKPIIDLIKPKPYLEQQLVLGSPQPKGMHYYWKSEFLPGLSEQLLGTYRRQGAGIESPMSQAILFQLGGAVAERDAGYTSFGNRDAAHIFFAAGCWPPGTADAQRYRTWVRSAWEAVTPYSTGGNYVNAQTADEDEARTRDAYGDSHDRLARVKAAYDPDNLFRVNRNIRPMA